LACQQKNSRPYHPCLRPQKSARVFFLGKSHNTIAL